VSRILVWPVHGSYLNALVQGPHEYLLPVVPGWGADGSGRLGYPWPASAREVPAAALGEEPIDAVIVQRPRDAELCAAWTGRVPGRDLPAIWLEHNAPQGRIAELRHPAADLPGALLVHVTHFNALFWDAGDTPTRIVEHGVVDPGYRYTGELPRAVVVINEARRRARVTGTDLLPRFARAAPLDLLGIDAAALGGIGDVRYEELHAVMGRRRVYLHPIRWTSLGLALLEAMHVGLPVVALATTEVADAVPEEAGVVSTDVDRLTAGLRRLIADPDEARERGLAAREAALAHYGLERFLRDWDDVIAEVVA
jgi:glycosyltransferase involved in cell wall biosynthesis